MSCPLLGMRVDMRVCNCGTAGAVREHATPNPALATPRPVFPLKTPEQLQNHRRHRRHRQRTLHRTVRLAAVSVLEFGLGRLWAAECPPMLMAAAAAKAPCLLALCVPSIKQYNPQHGPPHAARSPEWQGFRSTGPSVRAAAAFLFATVVAAAAVAAVFAAAQEARPQHRPPSSLTRWQFAHRIYRCMLSFNAARWRCKGKRIDGCTSAHGASGMVL